MGKYKDEIEYYLHSKSIENRSILMVAGPNVPIFELEKSVNIDHQNIRVVNGKFFIECTLPEEVDVAAFVQSKYSKIAPYTLTIFHSATAMDVMSLNKDFKNKIIENLVTGYDPLEIFKLNEVMYELDSLINEEEEYVLR